MNIQDTEITGLKINLKKVKKTLDSYSISFLY